MSKSRRVGFRWAGGTALLAVVASMSVVAPRFALATADVAAVRGSASGYHADEISLFGGSQPDTGPAPSAELAADASNSPHSASASTGLVQYGPATLFSSDGIDVETAGSLGPAGSVTSSAAIDNINQAATQPSTGSEIFTADSVRATCTASEAGRSSTTTITDGTLRTHAQAEDHDEGVVTIPTNPPPNYTVAGHVHLGSSQDNFVVVFNEQTPNPDGSVTVTAVHEYFGVILDGQGNMVEDPGSVLKGHLYLGRVVCGLIAAPTPTTSSTTTSTTSTTTTIPGSTTTTSTLPPSRAPLDAMIRRKGNAQWFGEDVNNLSATNQTVSTRLRRGERRVFQIKVRNDGDATDSFEIAGPARRPGFVTTYLRGRRNITAAVVSGAYVLEGIAPGETRSVKLVVKARRGVTLGRIASWHVTATSRLDPGAGDAVRARVRVKRG